MGFVLLGIATLTPVGLQASLIGNIAHGLITGLLFFLVGGVKDRFHTSEIDELGGGLLAKLPALGGLTLFAAIASLGLPGLAGFWGEMLAMLGAYHPAAGLSRPLFLVFMAIAGVGTVLTATYFLALLRRVDFGIVPGRWRDTPLGDVVASELVAWAPLVVLAVAVGVWPRLVLGITDAAVRGLLR
jgi:NADH-quinone oxidoreductase subunit M